MAESGIDADILEDENIDFGMDVESEEMVEETTKKIEPRGFHNFLNLDEVENYKSTIIANNVPETNLSWKDRQNNMNKGKEYTVAGMITEYTVRDGKRGGEKVAFLTLEDYAGPSGRQGLYEAERQDSSTEICDIKDKIFRFAGWKMFRECE